MERAGDGDPVGEVGVAAQRPGAEDRLRVRPGQRAEPVGHVRQHAARLHRVQQPLGTQRPRREHHLVRGEGALPGVYRPPRPDTGHRVPLEHLHAELLRQVQVVLHERVLGVEPAPGHVRAAVRATVAGRPGTAEERVHIGLSKVDTDRCRVERGADAHPFGDPLHRLVGAGHATVGGHAEHPLRLAVPAGQLVLPVGDVRPLWIVVVPVRRPVQRVGVHQRTAADTRAGQHENIAQQADPLDAVATESRRPQEVAHVPRGLRELVVGEAPAGFEYRDPVPLLGQPQGRDAAAEPGTDHHHVVVAHLYLAPCRPSCDRRLNRVNRAFRQSSVPGRTGGPGSDRVCA